MTVLTNLGRENRLFLYQTSRVRSILNIENQEQFVEELMSVESVLSSPVDARIYSRIPTGKRVRIIRGSMKGVCGRVERINNSDVLIVGVELFSRYVMITIATNDVEVLE